MPRPAEGSRALISMGFTDLEYALTNPEWGARLRRRPRR